MSYGQIPQEAVEAAAKAFINARSADNFVSPQEYAEKILEAAAPYMLSHEREQTRLAHLDAMVNRETKQAELAEVWNEGYAACNSRHIYSKMGGTEPDTANPYRPIL